MKLEKKIVIGISKEERNALKEIVDTVERALNIEINESPEDFVGVISGIYIGYPTIHTSNGNILIEYEK